MSKKRSFTPPGKKKELCVQNKRVYFGHDYATEVQNKRKEYIPIKKILQDNGVCFQTPLTRLRAFFRNGPCNVQQCCTNSRRPAEERIHGEQDPRQDQEQRQLGGDAGSASTLGDNGGPIWWRKAPVPGADSREAEGVPLNGTRSHSKGWVRHLIIISPLSYYYDVAFWQETHLSGAEHEKLKKMGFKNTFFSSYKKGKRRGVAILISNAVKFKSISQINDRQGRFVL